MNEEDFYIRQISKDTLDGWVSAGEDVSSKVESKEISIYPPKKIFEKIFMGGEYAVSTSEIYRTLAICGQLQAKLLQEAFDKIIVLAGKEVKVNNDEDYKKIAAEIITIHKKLDEDLSRLQNEKLSRYANSIKRNADRLEIFKRFKEQGMKDADVYREIIKMEEPNLKPGTASYIAAMNRLKVWRNRHKRRDVTH